MATRRTRMSVSQTGQAEAEEQRIAAQMAEEEAADADRALAEQAEADELARLSTIAPPAAVEPPMDEPLSGMTVAKDDLSALEGEGWVRVSRVSDDGEMLTLKKVERKILADDLTYLGRTWGGGRYWLEVMNRWRQWVKKFYVNFDEREYGPPKGSYSTRKADAPMGVPMDANDNPMLSAVVNQLQRSMEAKDLQIAALNDRQLTMQMEHNRTVIELIGKMSQRRDDTPGEFDRIIAAADKMVSARGPAPRGETDLAGTLVKQILPVLADGFKEFMTKRPTAAAAAAPDSTALERMAMPFIESFLPLLTRGLANQAAGPKRVFPPQKGQPPTSSQRPATGQPLPVTQPKAVTATMPEGATLLQQIKSHPMYNLVAPMVLDRARANADADEIAEEIADSVPERFWGAVIELVQRDDMPEYLALFEPELANHRTWLLAVQTAIKEKYLDDGGAETDEDVAGSEDAASTPAPAPASTGVVVIPPGEAAKA